VFDRGNARNVVFKQSDDYILFIDILKSYKERFNIKIYHWVIMPNHYHLLMQLDEPRLISKIMAGLNRTYTHFHHKRYQSAGFLWQGRFKSQPVQKERYLIACARYIERNPVKAHIVNSAWEHPYSSAKYYCCGESDSITSDDPQFMEFGEDPLSRIRKYKEFLENYNADEEKIFSSVEPAGDDEFKHKLVKIRENYFVLRKGRPKYISANH